ncbi:helix-turn-helix domain-containing protein [Vibrio alginolyticus]|uniref:helix-turn-helix domain-containing protein n=1 Tax=Vibrio alginolyticus TaxID=663 RepID=UPI0035A2D124
MNSIAFLYGAQTRRLKKIIHKTRDRDLCRRANAVLLVLKGKTKSEVASLLQAGRSSLNRWLKWYDVAGVDGLKTKGVGRPVRQNRDFICGVLKILLKYTPRTLGYQRSRWSTELFALLLNKYATFRSTVQQSDAGCPKQELSGGELRRLFISKTWIKRRNWQLSGTRWLVTVSPTRCFTRMKWTSI